MSIREPLSFRSQKGQTNCEGGNRFRNFSLPYAANECIVALFSVRPCPRASVCPRRVHLYFCSSSKRMETRAMRNSVQLLGHPSDK